MRSRLVEGLPLEVATRHGAPVLGIEHEFRVFDGDRQLDFATFIHNLPVDGLRLDPTDPNAYRTPWGGLVTADGREAEVAIAPVTLRPGCTAEVEWRVEVAQRALLDLLPARLQIEGYSTHVNVEIDDEQVVAAGRLLVRRFAPAMMLLLDRASSPGLLVRPRYGRLELCGEYCIGDQLRVASAFAAAASLTCAAAVRSPAARRNLPRAVRARIKPSNIRAGWYVDRRAFGADLYRDGRSTRLRCGFNGTSTAQEHLTDAWARVRGAVEDLLDTDELALVDRVVDGTDPIPLEGTTDTPLIPAAFEGGPFEDALRPRARSLYSISAVSVAWDAVVFRLHGARDAVACVPRAALSKFLDDLDRGRLDAPIERFLASPAEGRILLASDRIGSPALFDEVASRWLAG